jgi:hypothetical protein
MTTVTTFATAVDVTLAELKLEAFLPADQATAEALQSAGNASTRPTSQGPAARTIAGEPRQAWHSQAN